MRLTDDRYSGERRQFELAIRMIQHEARTRTIRECTGLSDDRIRKIYATYFQQSAGNRIRRRRGKSPKQVTRFVKSPEHQLQATTLLAMFCASLVVRVDESRKVHACWPRPDVEFGHRVCRAFESYQQVHPNRLLNFEWAWNLLQCICYNDELFVATCGACEAAYVQDSYALDMKICPGCQIERDKRKVI